MKRFYISLHYKLLLFRFSVALGILMLTRLLFLAMNPSTISGSLTDIFLASVRYDITTTSILLIPVVLLHLFPTKLNNTPVWQALISFFLILACSLAALFNCIDAAWFPYTQKRTGYDFFALITTGNDVGNNIGQYLLDYWYVLIFWLLLLVFLFFTEKRIRRKVQEFAATNPPIGNPFLKTGIALLLVALNVIGFRGGLQLKPLSLQAAARMVPSASIPLVLNTPYTIIKTMGRTTLTDPQYMSNRDAEKVFAIHQIIPTDSTVVRKNIVVIILESFSFEYISYYSPDKITTPFLDSLMRHAHSWPNTFANAKRSIEGIPAVVASMPNLMDQAFINSAYNVTRLNSLASLLKPDGYTSGFFHGGNNGTMGFDNFSRLCGYENYYGRNEYNGPDSDYDGQWGISDHAYYHFMIGELNKWKQPFTATFFSLSSHHPYFIPPAFRKQVPNDLTPVQQGVFYADLSLRRFFAEARQQPWYANTVFIITADHSGPSGIPYTAGKAGAFHIPLVIVNPSDSNPFIHSETAQQTDILPTALGLSGYKGEYTAFGRNLFTTNEGWAVNYSNNYWSILNDHFLVVFDGAEITHIFDRSDLLEEHNLLSTQKANPEVQQMVKKLKAVIQQFNLALLHNSIVTTDEKTAHTH